MSLRVRLPCVMLTSFDVVHDEADPAELSVYEDSRQRASIISHGSYKVRLSLPLYFEVSFTFRKTALCCVLIIIHMW